MFKSSCMRSPLHLLHLDDEPLAESLDLAVHGLLVQDHPGLGVVASHGLNGIAESDLVRPRRLDGGMPDPADDGRAMLRVEEKAQLAVYFLFREIRKGSADCDDRKTRRGNALEAAPQNRPRGPIRCGSRRRRRGPRP